MTPSTRKAESSKPTVDGLVVVDKPPDWTSHDVVARMRRIAGTRKVGHAGTLDPMATGVLVLGLGKATRLLGRISDSTKTYNTTIRLGRNTNTDDAQGEPLPDVPGVKESLSRIDDDPALLGAQVAALTGRIWQRPSSVSAIKVDGKRSYARVRAGEEVELAKRQVTVSEFAVLDVRFNQAGTDGVNASIEVDARVQCSSGTYIRALARDLGAALGTGAHLTALRRTRVGRFDIQESASLEELESGLRLVSLSDAVARLFPVHTVTADEARAISYGGRIAWPTDLATHSTLALVDGEGSAIALGEYRVGELAPIVVWVTP